MCLCTKVPENEWMNEYFCPTNKDPITIGWFRIVVFVQISRECPDDNRVYDEDVTHMFVQHNIFQDKPK